MKKKLIITGDTYTDWRSITRLLSGDSDYESVLENNVTAFNINLSTSTQINSTIKDRASETLANLPKNKILAWADSQTICFLELWSSIESNNRFIIVYTSPEETFAKALEENKDNLTKVIKLVTAWESKYKVALDFFQRNRNICLLVNETAVIGQRDELLKKASELVGRELISNDTDISYSNSKILATNTPFLLPNYENLLSLYDEMQSAATIPGEDIKLTGPSDKRLREFAKAGIDEYFLQNQKILKLTKTQINDENLENKIIEIQHKFDSNLQLLERYKDNLQSKVEQNIQFEKNVNSQRKVAEKNLNALSVELKKIKNEYDLLLSNSENLKRKLNSSSSSYHKLVSNTELLSNQKNDEISELNKEVQINLVQINKLQEEVEAINFEFENFKKTEKDKALLNTITIENFSNQLSQQNQENVRCQDKIVILEEDLSLKESKFLELGKTNATIFNKQNEDIKALHYEQQLAEQQLLQLQQEIEQNHLLNSNFQINAKQQESIMKEKINYFENKTQLHNQDQELSLLQLKQLQIEVEYYYSKYEDLNYKSVTYGESHFLQRAEEYSCAEEIEILSFYNIDGYKDIVFNLKNLTLGDGRVFDNIVCKLLLIEDTPGIEFRKEDNNELLTWPNDMSDEYGPYLLYMPSSKHDDVQKKLSQSLLTNDRQVINSAVYIIRDTILSGNYTSSPNLEDCNLQHWRLTAIKLSKQIRENSFLTYNSVKMKEEYKGDGYQHLWLQFDSLQYGLKIFPSFDFKIAAVSTLINKRDYSDLILLEFRDIQNNTLPFEAWPPKKTDEFGCKLIVQILHYKNKLHLIIDEELTTNDRNLIIQLIKFLPNILSQCKLQGDSLSEHWHTYVSNFNLTDISFGAPKLNLFKKIVHKIRNING